MSNVRFPGSNASQAFVSTAGNVSGGIGTRPAEWPSAHEFNEAIQNLAYSMSDEELRRGEPSVNQLGLPMPYSGGFADIYRVHCPATGNTWAVKCFTRGAAGLQQRYAAISQHLKSVRLPFMVDFDYIEQGVRIRGAWYPIVKMQWVEGLNLNAFVAQSLQQPATLDQLFQHWVWLSRYLRNAGVAHADLQHGNVLLVQVPGTVRLGLRLIDYDGMYVPALAGQRSGEVGHPAFQHPRRLREGTYTRHVDLFSHLAICCSIRALRLTGRSLWDRYNNGDNLLFREQDFAAPTTSTLFRELWRLPDPFLQVLVGRLALATQAGLEQTPAIDELILDGRGRELSTEERNAVQSLLEPSRHPAPPPKPPEPPRAPSNDNIQKPETIGLVPIVLKRIDDFLIALVGRDDPFRVDVARLMLILAVICGTAFLTAIVTWKIAESTFIAPSPDAGNQPTAVRDSTAANAISIVPGTNVGDPLTVVINDESVRFRWCPPGTFVMGSPASESERYSDENQVQVTLTQGFWLMETECWQKLWVAVMGSSRDWSNGRGDRYPAYDVGFNDALSFAARFQAIFRKDDQWPENWRAALPTEAQWEYAVRAGSPNRFCFGDDERQLGDYAWYNGNSALTTHEVGTKKPNAWGLFDGHGSLREWTADRYDHSLTGGVNPTGPNAGSQRVVRGGSWFNAGRYCRSADRSGFSSEARNSTLGFRLALIQSP